jgi:hypothetical protein
VTGHTAIDNFPYNPISNDMPRCITKLLQLWQRQSMWSPTLARSRIATKRIRLNHNALIAAIPRWTTEPSSARLFILDRNPSLLIPQNSSAPEIQGKRNDTTGASCLKRYCIVVIHHIEPNGLLPLFSFCLLVSYNGHSRDDEISCLYYSHIHIYSAGFY